MTREDVKTLFPDATDEQITKLLNQTQSELTKEKKRAEKNAEDAQKVAELQKQLDELNNQNLSDIEKANKATESANAKIAELESQLKTMNIKNSLAEQGIVGDNADKLVESLNSGNFDAKIIGDLISAATEKAVSDYKKSALEGTPNPQGGSKDGDGEKDKANAEMLSSIAKSIAGGSSKESADIVNAYA